MLLDLRVEICLSELSEGRDGGRRGRTEEESGDSGVVTNSFDDGGKEHDA